MKWQHYFVPTLSANPAKGSNRKALNLTEEIQSL